MLRPRVSDGLFAIASTMLVTVSEPDDDGRPRSSTRRAVAVAAYVVSLVVIGIMWCNGHSIVVALEQD